MSCPSAKPCLVIHHHNMQAIGSNPACLQIMRVFSRSLSMTVAYNISGHGIARDRHSDHCYSMVVAKIMCMQCTCL